jgi:hypothetical protein
MTTRIFGTVVGVALLTVASVAPAAHHEKDHEWTELFNGRNLDGWTSTLAKDVPMADVWSVSEDGVLRCEGRPRGVLRTKKEDYSDYIIEVEWRWPEGGGNNGLLVHTSDSRELGIWPQSMEVQLQSGNAGDFWKIGQKAKFPHVGSDRDNGRNIKRRPQVEEKPLGEWNNMTVRCEGDTVTVWVNGEKANVATDIKDAKTGESITSGAISLQSEGTPIEYRTVRLRPIE